MISQMTMQTVRKRPVQCTRQKLQRPAVPGYVKSGENFRVSNDTESTLHTFKHF